MRDLYGRCDYAVALARLVHRSPALHAGAQGRDARTAWELMVAVYGCAMGSLINVGYPAHAWLAAERCTEAAQHLHDAVAMAVAATNRARVLAYSGAYGPARTLCERADGDLQHDLDAPHALDVSGFLHLARALQTAGLHDVAAAEAHLGEAARIAAYTGESAAWDLVWGPRNVALWTMAFYLDTGRPAEALHAAAGVGIDDLPPVRQVYFYLDMARGLCDVGRDGDAERMLLAAERTGAQHTRSSVAARETARSMLHRSREPSSALRGLCERLGVAD